MSVDIKRLLYSYMKLQVSLQNIRDSIKREQSKREYPSCTPGYSTDIRGKGGLPTSQTERFALFNVELDDNTQTMQWDAEEHEYVIKLIESALQTLPVRQQQLVRLSYFEGKDSDYVAYEMNVSMSRYYHLNKLAMDGVESCLNGGKIFRNRLIPTKATKKRQESPVLVCYNVIVDH